MNEVFHLDAVKHEIAPQGSIKFNFIFPNRHNNTHLFNVEIDQHTSFDLQTSTFPDCHNNVTVLTNSAEYLFSNGIVWDSLLSVLLFLNFTLQYYVLEHFFPNWTPITCTKLENNKKTWQKQPPCFL